MISLHDKMAASFAACGAALLLALLTPPAAPAAPVTGACNPTKIKFSASALANSTTSSPAFVNIPEAAVSFLQGGASASCVIVRFSATTYAQNGIDVLGIRAFLDNTTAGLPASIGVRSETDSQGFPRSFEFIFPSVAPGNHTVRIQFNNSKSAVAHVKEHNTVVHYAP